MAAPEDAVPPLDSNSVPRHVAIIMDGNGRWAEQRSLPRTEGHRRGVASVRTCVRAAAELGIRYLTLYAFSSENWRRPRNEVSELMGLLKRFIRRDLVEMHEENVQLRVIGSEDHAEDEVAKLMREAVHLTRNNTGLVLTVAFNYGARDEIVRAARALAIKAHQGEIDPAAIDAEQLEDHLDTAGLPEPDLLIRTGGEQRISNFLLWQCAYTEFVFCHAFWPEFTKEMLAAAVAEYQHRERRFGGIKARCSA
ncbi:MAG: isoprenyl transferase [Alphaproteobacteria bacterium]